jgi:hypothetical protein
MNKKEAIQKLNKLHLDIELMDKFKGRAYLLKSISKKIRHLSLYKSGGNLPALFVSEAEKDLANIQPTGGE